MKFKLTVKIFCLFIFILFHAPWPAQGAQETLRNIQPELSGDATPEPGWIIELPDGNETVIVETLPNGAFQTQSGVIFSPDGVILNGDFAGQRVIIDRDNSVLERRNVITDQGIGLKEGASFRMPNGEIGQIQRVLPNGDFLTSLGISLGADGIIRDGLYKGQKISLEPAATDRPNWRSTPKKVQVEQPQTPTWRSAPKQEPAMPAATPVPEQPKPVQTPGTAQRETTIAELLPHTALPGKEKKTPGAPKTETPKKAAPKEPAAPKAGDHIRIPPAAIASGDLSFLEGCWQGTRPEYKTKRTVKECFCFGKGGKNGKRRVNDVTRGVQCIGASSASLGANGVLSVTSQKMSCTDGNGWVGAKMTCRNSGQRTPCSWHFPALGASASQSYEIPFVRVDSCGR